MEPIFNNIEVKIIRTFSRDVLIILGKYATNKKFELEKFLGVEYSIIEAMWCLPHNVIKCLNGSLVTTDVQNLSLKEFKIVKYIDAEIYLTISKMNKVSKTLIRCIKNISSIKVLWLCSKAFIAKMKRNISVVNYIATLSPKEYTFLITIPEEILSSVITWTGYEYLKVLSSIRSGLSKYFFYDFYLCGEFIKFILDIECEIVDIITMITPNESSILEFYNLSNHTIYVKMINNVKIDLRILCYLASKSPFCAIDIIKSLDEYDLRVYEDFTEIYIEIIESYISFKCTDAFSLEILNANKFILEDCIIHNSLYDENKKKDLLERLIKIKTHLIEISI